MDHVGIAVRSIARSRGIYESLGLAVGREEIVAHEQVKTALIPLGESRLELIEPTSEDSTVGRFLYKRGEGLHHIALRAADLDTTLKRLKSGGVRLVHDSIQLGAGGQPYFFIHPASAGGVLIEIVGGAAGMPESENPGG